MTLWFIDAAERALSAEKRKLIEQQRLEGKKAGNPQNITYQNNNSTNENLVLDTPPIEHIHVEASSQPYFVRSGECKSVQCGVWDINKRSIVYQVKFSSHSAVATTAVDIVERATLLVHCTQHSYEPLSAPLTAPPMYQLDEDNTTAKYSKKKGILTIAIQCISHE